jgi:hypothetical protein
MAEFLAWVRHPDGDIPLLNDAALGAVSTPGEILQCGRLLGVETHTEPRCGGRRFGDAGVVTWHGTPWTVFFDVGRVGPDCQPGHAHADTLTVECSVGGRRLFVDPGTHSYDCDAVRRYDRSTAAHNTVCIGGEDSSEVWHIFRVGRRAEPRSVSVDIQTHGLRAEAEHDGFDRLPGRPRHARRVSVQDRGPLEMTDTVAYADARTGARSAISTSVEGGFLLAPEWTATPASAGWIASCEDQRVRVSVRSTADVALSIERRPIHPRFGVEVQSTRLTWRYNGRVPLEVVTRVELD